MSVPIEFLNTMFASAMTTATRRRRLRIVLLVGAVALGCDRAQADEEGLRDSFLTRIATSRFVSDFTRDGDELRFSGPDGQGGTAAWRVRIDLSLVEPNKFDEDMPYQGRITSEWTANGSWSNTWAT